MTDDRRQVAAHAITRTADGRMYLGLTLVGGETVTVQLFSPQEAMLLLDILRHEGPVYADAAGTLFTGEAPIVDGS